MISLFFSAFLVLFLFGGPTSAASVDDYERCLLQALKSADDTAPVGDIKAQCREEHLPSGIVSRHEEHLPLREQQSSALQRRVLKERHAVSNVFAITPHRQNYLLMASYNHTPNGAGLSLDESAVDRFEMKFQLSFKTLLAANLLGPDNGYLYGAYTMKSFWQAFNSNISSPFRETNHEPELFLAYRNDWQIFGWKNSYILAGINHQSNGRSSPLSRSWNRFYVDFIFDRGNWAVSVKPWYRIPEEGKAGIFDASGDDNPDISRYLGYGEVTAAWSYANHTVSCMLRNNLRSHSNRGSFELGWSFPLWQQTSLKGYVQYFNGYGESLVDYNTSVNRLGVGVLLADWL